MKGVDFIAELQRKLAIPDFVTSSAKVAYENAVAKKLDTKHNIYALSSAAVYLFAKRSGVNITLTQLSQYGPATKEEIMNAHEELRRLF